MMMNISYKGVCWGFTIGALLVIYFLSVNSPNVYAHPGRTDSSGGHTCRTNCPRWGLDYGQYHMHGGATTPAPSPEPEFKPQIEEATVDTSEQPAVETQTNLVPQQNNLQQQEDEQIEGVVEEDNSGEAEVDQTKDKSETANQTPDSSIEEDNSDEAGSVIGRVFIFLFLGAIAVGVVSLLRRNE